MAQPLLSDSQIFGRDQRITFGAHYWDTTTTAIRAGLSVPVADRLTAFGSGIEFAMFDLYETGFEIDTADPETDLNDTALMGSVLGYDAGVYRVGRVPNIYSYWGSGAPPGGSRNRQVVLKFSGYIQADTDPISLVFAGQGTVFARVRHTGGTYTTLVNGAVKEPIASVNTAVVTPAIIRDEWGYQYSTARSFLAGEYVEIYYVHDRESWGGIAAKAVTGSMTTDSDEFLSQVRAAPVVGVSFMAAEDTPIAAQTIEYLISASMKTDVKAVTEVMLEVAITDDSEASGYWYDKANRQLVDNVTPANTVKEGRAVHLEGGFLRPDGTEELYGRFTGYIDEIFPTSERDTAMIVCRSFDGRMKDTFDDNLPDRLDYHAAGFILREPSSEPVYGIPAADHWPLETLFGAMHARAGIDSYNIGLLPGADSDHGRFRFTDSVSGDEFFGTRLFSARALGDSTQMIQLERNPNYGNVPPLTKDYLPPDDAYLYPPEVTSTLWDRLHTLVEHFGYDYYFNAYGQAVFTGRNNPMYFQYATSVGTYTAVAPSDDQLVDVNAVGGTYLGVTHAADPAWSRIVEGHFARLDMYTAIGENADGLNGGFINVLIERADGLGGWTTVSDTDYSTYSSVDEAFYYDGVVRSDGTNAALFPILSLPFDHYRVTVSAGGPDTVSDPAATDCWYRLNGFAVYERNVEQSSYMDGDSPYEFSTLGNVFSISPSSNLKDLRNHVVVIGGRRATITDSAKLDNAVNTAVNNPEREFHVAVAVDPFSIYDPTSDNYVGMKRMTVVFDDKIADTSHAQWLTRAFLAKYKNPPNSAQLTHSVVPTLDVRDALYVVEEANLTVEHLLWVQSFTERWDAEGADVSIDFSPYPEIPSYQPREDIDIDTLFVDPADGKGEPLINLAISYRNIYGRMVGNDTLTEADAIKAFTTRTRYAKHTPMFSEVITNGASQALTYPAIPETMYLGWTQSGLTHLNGPSGIGDTDLSKDGYVRFGRRALVNGPYRHFWELEWSSVSKLPTMQFNFQEGDGTAGIYDQTYYGFPTTDVWRVFYDYLTAREISSVAVENPWYDPYTSEFGNLVDISFDLLVSGRIRASVWAYSESLGMEIPVAWLTQPAADADTPEAHWSYRDAGNHTFSFDGVDNIGLWNTLQSFEYAEQMEGAFGDKPMAVGKGFYAWNDKSTNLHTLIGDDNSWDNSDGRGLRKINYDANGEPYYTIGQFSQFYVKVEVANDVLMRRDFSNGHTAPRVVDSRELPLASGMNDVDETYIWQHLGEPTQVGIRIQDWSHVDAFGTLVESWVPGMATVDADWTQYSTPDEDASVRVGKPVRITFEPKPHRGPMWENAVGDLDASIISAKLTRQVHHKGTVFDQFWSLAGKSWEGFHKNWIAASAGVENKRLQNRMFHNEDHTLEYEDTEWRTGASFDAYEWIFDPSLFEKDFGFGIVEQLRYADYEQLEQLPGFDARRFGGTASGARAYLMLAYLSHLFYFSAFVLDRSGRRQHCINSWTDDTDNKRGWIDRTKIVTPAVRGASATPGDAMYSPEYIIDYERRGADKYLMRSMFVRQWKEPGWASGTYPNNPVDKYAITSAHQQAYVQVKSTDFDPYLVGSPLVATGLEAVDATIDLWLQEYQREGSAVAQMMRYWMFYHGLGSTYSALDTDPVIETVPDLHLKPTSFGTWTWDRPGLTDYFSPNPTRDFHPYMRYPLTPDPAMTSVNQYLQSGTYSENPAGAPNALEAPTSNIAFENRDYSAQELWFGYAFSDAFALDYYNDHAASIEATRYRHYGARLEQTVEEFGEIGPNSRNDTDGMTRTKIEAMFDYAKQDQLDRWEQFRGMIARAPYSDRQDWDNPIDIKRRSSAQPVKPSGVYLFNTGRLDDIILGATGRRLKTRCHWTTEVHSFFDLRFMHEYVWYSDRFFPVTREGGAAYMFLRDEYTGVSGWVGYPWRTSPIDLWEPTQQLFYDSGAWVGWRPDSTGAELKWKEASPITENMLNRLRLETLSGQPDSSSPAGEPYHEAPNYFTTEYRVQSNIHDEYLTKAAAVRLAVGPELPEQRNIYMNLSLPERLRGD